MSRKALASDAYVHCPTKATRSRRLPAGPSPYLAPGRVRSVVALLLRRAFVQVEATTAASTTTHTHVLSEWTLSSL